MKKKRDNVVLKVNINPKLVGCMLKDNEYENLSGRNFEGIEIECDYTDLAGDIKNSKYGDTLDAIDSFIANNVAKCLTEEDCSDSKRVSGIFSVEINDETSVDELAKEIAGLILSQR